MLTDSHRLGMHLMFYGGTQIKVLHNCTVAKILRYLSIRVSERAAECRDPQM